jgi:predicted nucleotidyltransferase
MVMPQSIAPERIVSAAKRLFGVADRWLSEELGEGEVEKVYLVGSVAEGAVHAGSDIDLLFVGDGFNQVEDERIAQSEEGALRGMYKLLDVDVPVSRRAGHPDIIFSSRGPAKSQKSVKLYDASQGGWLV